MFATSVGGEEKSKGGNFDTDVMKVDEEQVESFEQIQSLLVAGGYFRAMIKSLDHFDKVAGGLAWCITASNENVDIMLLFEEHSRMGEKVTLSENIEGALVEMGCPHALQAQQILHLDCINILPVVRWLIAKVIEVRKETGDLVRQYSEAQFSRFSYKLPAETQKEQTKMEGLEYVQEIKNKFIPKRSFKMKKGRTFNRHNKFSRKNEDERVHTVLLEYGQAHLYTMALLQKEDDDGKKKKPKLRNIKVAGAPEEDEADERKEALKAQERANKLLSAMKQAQEGISSSAVGSILTAQSDELREARDTAKAEMDEAQSLQSQSNQKEHGEFYHQRYIQDVDKKIQKAQLRLEEMSGNLTKQKAEMSEIQTSLEKKLEFNRKIVEETEKLNSTEQTPENQKNKKILQDLVALNENLKAQTSSFRQNCQNQKQEWEQRIETLKKEQEQTVSSSGAEIIEAHKVDSEKLAKLRELFALKNRQVALVKRKIDSVPSRRELQQYQRQFVEVFEQMAVKYTETKQFFNMFNSSEKIRAALEHEVKLLNSIKEMYPTVRGNKNGRAKFLDSLKGIITAMDQRLQQQVKLHEEEKQKRNDLDKKYIEFIEQERQYYAAAKAYQEECAKTELLENKIRRGRKEKKEKKDKKEGKEKKKQ